MKKARSLLLCLLVLLPLASCGKGGYQEDMHFQYMLPASVSSLDPQTCKLETEKTVISMLFEGLCRLDSTGTAVPGAASQWETDSSYTRYTFYLRQDAKWSNGEALVAEDFVFGIRRALNPSSKAVDIEPMFLIQNARAVNAGEAEIETLGVYAPDSHTVVFELSTPYQDFPELTAGIRFMPCKQSFFEDTIGHYGMDTGYLLTNGPFSFAGDYAWEANVSIALGRNIHYTGDHPVLPQSLTLLLTQETVNKRSPLNSLEDEAVDLVPIAEEDLDQAKAMKAETITLHDTVYGLLLNTQDEFLQYLSLRRIYLSAIDRKEVISRMGEQYEEANGIMPKCIRWAGNSYQHPGEVLYATQNRDISQEVVPVISSLDLERLPSITILCLDDAYSKHLANGIIVSWNQNLPNMFNLEPLSQEDYNRRLSTGDYQAALYSFASKGTNPLSVFTQFLGTATPKLLADESYDNLLWDFSFTREDCRALEEALLNSYVFYPIHYTRSYYAINPKVQGITMTADFGPDFTAAVKRNG